MTELEQLKSWLKLNRQHFIEGSYTPDEVAWFAINDSFDPPLVHEVLSHWNDALVGSDFDRRNAMRIKCEVIAINGILDLTEQWQSLYRYLEYGKEWSD